MSRLILVAAIVSILLISCTPMKQRQERAYRVLDRFADVFVLSIEKAKELQQKIAGPLTNSARKVQETATLDRWP